MGKKALIFGSMPCGAWSFLEEFRRWPDMVIAADGGLSLCRQAGFRATAYIGDGDSGGTPEPGLLAVTLPREKDVTDLEAAYLWARDQGAEEMVFTCCTGGRLDHHFAAMGLLETAAREGFSAAILDPRNRVEFLLPGAYCLPDRGYRYFSLIPSDRLLRGLSIIGAKYPLSDRDVRRGGSLTVSNEFAAPEAEISFREGCCWLVYSN